MGNKPAKSQEYQTLQEKYDEIMLIFGKVGKSNFANISELKKDMEIIDDKITATLALAQTLIESLTKILKK